MAQVSALDTSVATASGSDPAAYRRSRLLILCLLFLLLAALYRLLAVVSPPTDGNPLQLLPVWGLSFLGYFLACGYIVATRPLTPQGRWTEVGVILLGALLFRLMLLPLPPGLSRDVWRYLWDARVVVHGYSPYVYAPGDAVLKPLRNILFINCRFRNIPTIYPPGAEGIFILGYLISPRSLDGIKALFLVFDVISCGGLAWLLALRKVDPRMVIIYAWCPLPLVELAINGHVDVLTVTFMVLSVLCATSPRRNARLLTGLFIAMATLTRLYPIVLLPLLLRRRDWPLLVTFFVTISLGYLPFILMGHGNVFGFLPTYSSQQGGNAGIVQTAVRDFGAALRLHGTPTIALEYAVDFLLVIGVLVLVLVLRRHERISVELGILLLISTVFMSSSHIFPWYVTALLPWIAFLVDPTSTEPWSMVKCLAAAVAWYAACTAFLSYIDNVIRVNNAPWWATFFLDDGAIIVRLGTIAAILLVFAGVSQPLLRRSGFFARAG